MKLIIPLTGKRSVVNVGKFLSFPAVVAQMCVLVVITIEVLPAVFVGGA